MDNDAKKTALRSITYGLYVVTAIDGDDVGAAAMNWLTQDLVRPALVGAALKSDSGACALAGSSGAFAVNVLGTTRATADRDDYGGCFTGSAVAGGLDLAPMGELRRNRTRHRSAKWTAV
jgi:flavin reductase (DIM6/NTAB) family NADH-FMN oxidoreductase RutF